MYFLKIKNCISPLTNLNTYLKKLKYGHPTQEDKFKKSLHYRVIFQGHNHTPIRETNVLWITCGI